ncbi:hypothetical protein Pmani_032950 [Petrolisthes manimaculis]|uniref:Uncharacterized protein n=1 Tax=Petrolisthes manimaculis TaxID=1843537 RepID=A0AAE1TT94_9EUCA|nr:hypothetical protein Pmani_032950 [Petrolisthes manimaculis]
MIPASEHQDTKQVISHFYPASPPSPCLTILYPASPPSPCLTILYPASPLPCLTIQTHHFPTCLTFTLVFLIAPSTLLFLISTLPHLHPSSPPFTLPHLHSPFLTSIHPSSPPFTLPHLHSPFLTSIHQASLQVSLFLSLTSSPHCQPFSPSHCLFFVLLYLYPV